MEKLERRPSSNAHDEGAAIAQDAQLAFPLSSIPFGPTPAAYSVTVRVTCDDLAKYLPLLKEQGTELKFSACDQEHPQVSLMTVQFDLPGLDTVDEALPNPNPPASLHRPAISSCNRPRRAELRCVMAWMPCRLRRLSRESVSF